MSTTPKPSKFDLSNLIFKIEGIKLKLENPPKRGKISVTLQAKKDNTMPDKKDSVIESNHEKVNGEMEWKMNTDIVLDGRGLILVDIKEHHRSNPFASKSLVPNQFSLKNEDIFDTFVKSGVTGDTQEFILPEEHLTIILSLSCHSLENILKTFSPPQSLVSRLGKYQAGLDLMLQIATVLGGLNSKAGVVIGAVTQAFELLKSQEKCHKDILDLFAHMGDMLSVIADADPLKQHSKRVGGLIESTLNCIKDAVEQVLLKCRENMLKQLIFSSELAETISGFRDEFDNLREKYKLVLTQVTALLTLSSENARILMERLKPQPREGYKTCVDATRVSLLSDLVKSIKENSIVLLHGLAGTGKSSVMGSLEQKFHQRPVDSNLTGIELAVSFHCTRGTRSQDLSVLVPTLVYNIAQKFPAFGIYLANNLGIATSGGLYYQFKNLLHQPLASLKEENEYPTSQILVIIDALDEWAQDDESRKVFLVEIQRLCKNHDWLHFMITSRPNAEIMEALSSGKHLKTIDIQQDPNTQSDIENFLKQCLRTDKTMKQTITPDDELWLLSYVQSLFILADTAFKFLAQGLDPRKQLNILKKTQNGSKSGLNSYDVLYNLYTTVLEEAIQNHRMIKETI
ncbi:hypothetical protein BDP27DRAFT_1429140 [Rhodocollybia butyracea]|uniref:Nephrocystin 3-like N-terminal domain-containing protein n=1 Tax=Rhodocollybia butyracea TaxID=206335 RepID=A0A9P5PFQ3_9AGAR|nr:hypothetical protein BDP27DRAFT_1429140 [Rhodocollybia butyracea]